MAYWLFKSEPDVFSFDDLAKKGAAGQEWDGVRNYQARNNMRAMQLGDRGFFYHSNIGKEIVGIVEVAKLAHPDSTDDSGRWECVDLRAVRPVPKPYSLEMAKAEPRLEGMALVGNSRLSVQPVGDAHWKLICELCGLDPAAI
ncbi:MULTISPECIES: EVE domain-containing protein [Kaistia]|uniref:EVE domain-containing protein n=1 Tax=Kaistia nematophila TaxID=2994654 RepID=A0A9X3IKW6_9HYPH|nr:EVE domain-containing protein [Kaistia nematophila]MBN9025496.1 EVE domain-containing protein [Hyphomicrobiales bacterium]MBN9058611.1 EVE domain-containing protein [Hyphomicrobiales bacterium]MCX5570049.1 EVE domain-containing protein [Kaistia nematophila]